MVSGRWILPATILGSSLGFIDSSVVNVALPAIRRGLDTDLATLQWVVNGYLLTLASLVLLGGSAGDHFGRRRVFLVGLAGFTAASIGCGFAPAAGWLITARLVQGAAAALLMPTSLAIIGASYTGEARGSAIGTWAAAGALTTALGPPLGGWLVDTVGWRAIFFINLPLATAAMLLGLRLPVDRGTKRAEPLDGRGALFAALALGLLSYGLITLGAGARRVGAIAAAAAIPAIWLFVRTEARSASPMMPLSLFRHRDFAGANVLTILLYAALSGALFLMPFMLIQVHGYSATAAGGAFLPFAAFMGLGSRWSGGLVHRFGSRPPLIVGPSVTAAGFL
ncbi:MAG: MFS transporter, partial [Acidobacteriota bacterium]